MASTTCWAPPRAWCWRAARCIRWRQQALDESGGTEVLRRNMFAAITARAVEMVHAAAESIAIIEAYQPPADAWTPWEPRAGKASWASEAPRGVLFHRYEVDEQGRVTTARIVPPTSQNQAFMEDDMREYVGSVLDLPGAGGGVAAGGAHPLLRPLHQLRHALPAAGDRAHLVPPTGPAGSRQARSFWSHVRVGPVRRRTDAVAEPQAVVDASSCMPIHIHA